MVYKVNWLFVSQNHPENKYVHLRRAISAFRVPMRSNSRAFVCGQAKCLYPEPKNQDFDNDIEI
jgi:hypothetical protein